MEAIEDILLQFEKEKPIQAEKINKDKTLKRLEALDGKVNKPSLYTINTDDEAILISIDTFGRDKHDIEDETSRPIIRNVVFLDDKNNTLYASPESDLAASKDKRIDIKIKNDEARSLLIKSTENLTDLDRRTLKKHFFNDGTLTRVLLAYNPTTIGINTLISTHTKIINHDVYFTQMIRQTPGELKTEIEHALIEYYGKTNPKNSNINPAFLDTRSSLIIVDAKKGNTTTRTETLLDRINPLRYIIKGQDEEISRKYADAFSIVLKKTLTDEKTGSFDNSSDFNNALLYAGIFGMHAQMDSAKRQVGYASDILYFSIRKHLGDFFRLRKIEIENEDIKTPLVESIDKHFMNEMSRIEENIRSIDNANGEKHKIIKSHFNDDEHIKNLIDDIKKNYGSLRKIRPDVEYGLEEFGSATAPLKKTVLEGITYEMLLMETSEKLSELDSLLMETPGNKETLSRLISKKLELLRYEKAELKDEDIGNLAKVNQEYSSLMQKNGKATYKELYAINKRIDSATEDLYTKKVNEYRNICDVSELFFRSIESTIGIPSILAENGVNIYAHTFLEFKEFIKEKGGSVQARTSRYIPKD